MIEKLARAIWDVEDPTSGDPLGVLLHSYNPFVDESGQAGIEQAKSIARAAARACLEALREPSEAMLDAAFTAVHPLDQGLIGPSEEYTAVWQAMIDVALERKAA